MVQGAEEVYYWGPVFYLLFKQCYILRQINRNEVRKLIFFFFFKYTDIIGSLSESTEEFVKRK